jgi:ABC-2 type transport system ATP-binding protein
MAWLSHTFVAMSVSIHNLTKVYGTQRAVDSISFSVQPGQVVGFLGPNGAGKSTTMKIITCFIPQTEGTATVCGYDVNNDSMQVKRCVGYLPESNPLYTDMYVQEYLTFVGRIHRIKDSRTRIRDMIRVTGLDAERKKKIGQLSKGYRQRVGLAQAMLHDPQVLILDEPTSGLDPNQLREIRALIKELGTQKTVILSTHILQEVQAICDRVIIIHKGKIVADDSTEALQRRSQGETGIQVEFAEAIQQDQLASIPGVQRVEKSGTGYRLVGKPGLDIRTNVAEFAKAKNLTMLTLVKEAQSLENVFRELTEESS